MANRNMDDDLEMIDLSELSGDRHSNKAAAGKKDPDGDEYQTGRTSGKRKAESEEDDEEEESSFSGSKFIQIFMISAIIIIIAIVAVNLIRWQKGTNLVITEDDLTEDYDIESEDFYAPFDPYDAEGYVDDGELNIVILGDKTIYDCQDKTGIPALIGAKTGANVTTLALPDSTIALTKPSFTIEHAFDAFNLYYLIAGITGGKHGSYDLQASALNYMEETETESAYLEVLRGIDFETVDILIISYGLNDYMNASRITGDEIYAEQPYGTMDSLSGSLDSCLTSLNKRFPHMQVIVSSPSYCKVDDGNGKMEGADLVNPGGGSLGDYVALSKSVVQSHQASFADNYFFTDFNAEKNEGLLDENGMPNAKARELIADHIITFFYTERSSRNTQ